jgi:hypothetical protein
VVQASSLAAEIFAFEQRFSTKGLNRKMGCDLKSQAIECSYAILAALAWTLQMHLAGRLRRWVTV